MTSNLSDIRIGRVWVNVTKDGTVHAFDTEHLADFAQENRLHKLKLVFGWTETNVYTYISNVAVCRWTYDATHEKWDTECGTGFWFGEGGPSDNSYVFCPHCGERIELERG